MVDRFESFADKAIRAAEERGEFKDLPGLGKPLPGAGEHLHENWWLNDLVARENISGILPPALALRREIQDLPAKLDAEHGEQAVRDIVEELNVRIMSALRGPAEGPPVTVMPLKVDDVVREWRERRTRAA